MIAEGTRYHLPPEAHLRQQLLERLRDLFYAWGYEPIELPALEVHDLTHPLERRAFKLVDRNGQVLMLRSEFTTAVARLVRAYPEAVLPVRYQYAGPLWLREADAELGRMREHTQVGLELIGVSSPEADAELLELAWEALKVAGVPEARIEVGLPSFVRDILEAARLPEDATEALRRAVDRKNTPELEALVEAHRLRGRVREAILALPDLYGGVEVLREARGYALSERARIDLDWLERVLELLPEGLEVLLDLGKARRYEYYTGIHFRAYTPDFGLPLMGGGRYDGGLLPFAAGFALGLERLMEARRAQAALEPPEAIATDRALARRLRAEGKRVELAWTADLEALRAYARRRGIRYLAHEGRLVEVEP
ncbi:ATP phosphoribosyltransferase regulatory subunit [Marinithermus hydrothermalis]|uniref:ATP phosphoribosyltransferase regulatory subunit n=1 Tax=Marinithermus hydrothermalis (strain DSM 14884 / JCM 11576 / T1) TaxID=869210 RepID=F2NLS1_MARHT|nr:ATP phosphoribosyltransferase regulatory subunit [Marinithermus hydrothermalis]AEB10901.1 ATP phosphoribosyltransferase regulatory subunit [Marinithermus hydrothermalis DSM 14884]